MSFNLKLDVGTTLIVTFTLFIVAWLFLFRTRRRNLPPGPLGWPMVGSLPLLLGSEPPSAVLNRLGSKYGDVYSMNLGSCLVVVLNSYDAIKEALVGKGDFFSSRPTNVHRVLPLDKGVIRVPDNANWREHRRFTLSTLKRLGMGKSVLEDTVLNEVDKTIATWDATDGGPIDPAHVLTAATCNIILGLALNKRYAYDDGQLGELLQIINVASASKGVAATLNFLTCLKYLPGQNKHKSFHQNAKKLYDKLLNPILEEHGKNLETEREANDIISAYLKEMSRPKQIGVNNTMDIENLFVLIIELLLAGTDTTAVTLNWAIFYMASYGKVQDRVHDEIDQVIGRERRPTMADQPLLPYTETTLMEIQRISSIVPLALAHATSGDVSLRGYVIPKGTYVIPNLWSVHHEPRRWTEPEVFKPERFLGKDGSVIRSGELVPFGIGRRICLGMPGRMTQCLEGGIASGIGGGVPSRW
ncbi:cytochrome P450 2U1-like isoform X2 [Ptychodera flava]|uniref:cytochrome P450 2U1-like isoform X2 n=1 Tax=Ptychodera flava TaxID=63121 RepID=UPI00396A1AD6